MTHLTKQGSGLILSVGFMFSVRRWCKGMNKGEDASLQLVGFAGRLVAGRHHTCSPSVTWDSFHRVKRIRAQRKEPRR